MRQLTSSVGTNATNADHDVAIVQLMLAKVKKPTGGAPYFSGSYLDPFGEKTLKAIASYQTDIGERDPKSTTPQPVTIEPDSTTWTQLNAAFEKNPQFKKARTSPGQAVAYLAQDTLGAALADLNKRTLVDGFRKNVATLIENCFKVSELVWFVIAGTGAFREFAGQTGLQSDASYGETIHNYGLAVDLTLRDLSWVGRDNTLHTTILKDVDKTLQLLFFDGRDAVSKDMELYPTEIKERDRWHLQAIPDQPLDSVTSFMSLMQRVGPRHMRWEPHYKTPTDYHCDLGLGGEFYYVGTAKDIWNASPTYHITPANLFAALEAARKADETFSVNEFFGAGSKLPADFKESDIKQAQVTRLQAILKEEFQAAEREWRSWQPVNYPNEERRPKNSRKK